MPPVSASEDPSVSNAFFDDRERFVLEDYHNRPPFSSFLPGVAGKLGIPLWAFYVNRAQGISSFGVESKDCAIVEFDPANKAYRNVSVTGFRTFLRIKEGSQHRCCEPFGAVDRNKIIADRMTVGTAELELQEQREGLNTSVLYFTLPNESFAALVRTVTIQNSTGKDISGELIDGLPAVVPYGIKNEDLKGMSNTVQAWMRVENIDNRIPYFKTPVSLEDEARVTELTAGHFALAYIWGQETLLPAIVDSRHVFGADTALLRPTGFFDLGTGAIEWESQLSRGVQPCCFFATPFELAPGQEFKLIEIIGHARKLELVSQRIEKITDPTYINRKREENDRLYSSLLRPAEIRTASRPLDLYCRQNFLDNMLRGGIPEVMEKDGQRRIFYLYTQKHGDLERDYNDFWLKPEFYSSGSGNYRDVNQNRRCDVLNDPRIEDSNLREFMNLLQIDGYNPLVVQAQTYLLPPEKRKEYIGLAGGSVDAETFFEQPFSPGGLLSMLQDCGFEEKEQALPLFSKILLDSGEIQNCEFREGYWIDHWTYNLDLIDSLFAQYPDRRAEFLFDRRVYTYHDSAVQFVSRDRKCVQLKQTVRQYSVLTRDREKESLIASRKDNPHRMRTKGGHGSVYRTCLFEKLLCLALLKFATLDSQGMGVEMEADKPGWYDALNGLPALFGSSISESYELLRLLNLLVVGIEENPDRFLPLPKELVELYHGLGKLNLGNASEAHAFAFWEESNRLKEHFRRETRFGISGVTEDIALDHLTAGLESFSRRVLRGVQTAEKLGGGIPPTYFVQIPVRWERITDPRGNPATDVQGNPFVLVKEFDHRPLPLFLEGAVKALKMSENPERCREILQIVKSSELFDRKLSMYRVNASLETESLEIGRCRAFTPGWLENESIWLHMEYKFLLELLKKKLYREFWQEASQTLVPFMDPEVYGRSPLENSSFIVSSAHPDPGLHGRGFVARLSGSTAEFIQILYIVTTGGSPFFLEGKELRFRLCPILPGWLFSEDGSLSFRMVGHTLVTYHNPSQKDLFPGEYPSVESIHLTYDNGQSVRSTGDALGREEALAIRERRVKAIDIFFSEQH
jgi:hypothetical protein